MTISRFCRLAACSIVLAGSSAYAGTFSAAEALGTGIITHPQGYNGFSGGTASMTVGINPSSPNASLMETPTKNVLRTINAMQPTTGNLLSGMSNDVPSNAVDFESLLLHEMGHTIGLAHPNLGSESGLDEANADYTKALKGDNNVYDLNDGLDNVRGSRDDIRGDDENLNWFHIETNNPLSAPATIDTSTFSNDVADLPPGSSFPANPDRDVLAALGFAATEGIMQQWTFLDEAQRTMTNEEISTLRIGMAGVDEIQGTSDDYTIRLTYAGMTTNADIVIDFDSTRTAFATTRFGVTSSLGGSSNHRRLTGPSGSDTIELFFSEEFVWYFSQTPNGTDVDPSNIFVDFSAISNGDGDESSPFNNLSDALDLVEPAGTINVEPGSSSETFIFFNAIDQAVTIRNNDATSGRVTVGSN